MSLVLFVPLLWIAMSLSDICASLKAIEQKLPASADAEKDKE